MSIFRIIKNRVFLPFKSLVYDIEHRDYRLGWNRFVVRVTAGTAFSQQANTKIHKIIYKKLESDFGSLLEKYQDFHEPCQYDSSSPVWVFWMQGYASAPFIVKKCLDSIKKSTNHPVNVITSENLWTYYDFPIFIKDKYRKGIITHAQFSDILRMTLLAEYGGLWVDATIFIPNHIPEMVFQREFFSCKRKPITSGYISEYRWTSFLNGCQKHCVIQKAVKELFFAYWEKYDYLIDYLLVDYFILIVYNSIPKAKQLIDNLPYNNEQIEELQNRMNMEYDMDQFHELICHTNTYFFKLSWRMAFIKSFQGKLTYYGKFISE